MTNWRTVAKKLALSRGRVIDPKRAQIIKNELLADGKIDKDEFGFLMSLRREAQWIDTQLDDVIFKAAKPVLLKGGAISPQDTNWLKTALLSDGRVDERERQFLKELLTASDKHCGEFVAWCASLGLAPAKPVVVPTALQSPVARPAPAEQVAQVEKEVSRLIQSTEVQARWLRWVIVGLVCMMTMLGATTGWTLLDLMKRRNEPQIATHQPAFEEHKIVKARINGKEIRGLEVLLDDKTPRVFAKAYELNLKKGNNEFELELETDLDAEQHIIMWLTLGQSLQASLPPLDIDAEVNGGELVSFGKLGLDNPISNEKAARFRKGKQNRIKLNIQYAGPNAAPVKLQLNWKDDPTHVNLYVLGVGVSKYVKTPGGQSLDLRFADKDAEALVNVFKEQEENGLFAKVHAKQLLNEKATGNAILAQLKWIQKSTSEQDLVMLIFAGHGIAEDEKFYFLPHDYDPDRIPERNAVSWNEIEEQLVNMPCRVVVVMDACHSGAIKLSSGLRSSPNADKERVKVLLKAFSQSGRKRGVAVIAACTDRQKAHEKSDWQHGALSKCLLDCLTGQEGEAVISLNKLCYEAREKMKLLCPDQSVETDTSTNLSIQYIPIAIPRRK